MSVSQAWCSLLILNRKLNMMNSYLLPRARRLPPQAMHRLEQHIQPVRLGARAFHILVTALTHMDFHPAVSDPHHRTLSWALV